jgi:hypothetical protein
MDPEKRYKELLLERKKIKKMLNRTKKNLGHPHLDFMSVHDLAESQYKVYSAHLESVEEEIKKLEKRRGPEV